MRPPEEVIRVPVPEWQIVPQELWNAVRARYAAIDGRMGKQQKATGGATRRSGIGAARDNLSLVAQRLVCGECGGSMTNSSSGYVRCIRAEETERTACTNKRNWPRKPIEARLLDALHDELMSETALRHFMTVYNAEIDKLNAAHNRTRKAQEQELSEVTSQITNVVASVRQAPASQTLLAELTRLEERKAELETVLSEPEARPYSLHPNAAGLYRQKITDLASALQDAETGPEARASIRDLVEQIVLTPARERGPKSFELEVEGDLAPLLKAAGFKPQRAAEIDETSKSSGQSAAPGCSG